MKNKFTSTVAGASIFITITLLFGRGLGLFREIIIANYFGLSDEYDQYLVASVIPVAINSVILYLAQNYFIPEFNSNKKISDEQAEKFSNFSFWLFFIGGTILGLCIFFLSENLLSIYLGGKIPSSDSVKLFKLLSVSIPIFTGSAILSAYLQANYEFRIPALSQLLSNIALIIIVLFFQEQIGVESIAYGYVFGTAIQLILLIFKTQKTNKLFQLKYFSIKENLQFIKLSIIIILLIEILGQVYAVADRFYYGQVDPGGIAALNYAFNLYMLPISIFSLAMSTAIFPSLSEQSSGSTFEIENKLNNFFSVNIFLFVPITLVLFFHGELIVKLFFERGQFNSSDTEMTFSVLKIYSISLIFYSSYAVVNKIFYGNNIVNQLLIITITGVGLKIILNYLLVDNFKEEGLAISSSASFILIFFATYFFVVYKLRLKNKMVFIFELIIQLTTGIISYFISVRLISLIKLTNSVYVELIQGIIFLVLFLLSVIILKLNSWSVFTNTINAYKYNKRSNL